MADMNWARLVVTLDSSSLTPGTDDNMAGLVWARKTHEDVTSEEFFELIDSWMDECKGDHPECMQRNDMVLPSRVIDVGSEGNDPYLFIAGGQTGRWITLSYCWGGKPPLRTELWNLRQRCERIPFDELPVLFRDAVIITRRLGYKYLWIDALCIIQDSPKDWTIESANMGYIYKESSMTIIAEASEDCEVGIFESTGVDREAILFKISSHSTASNTRGTLYLGQNMVDGQISRGPVSLRAWTLQEAILSRRVLRFARGQVWWQCHRAQWNERDPCGIASTALTKWKSSMSPRLTLERGNEQFDTPWCKPLRCWYRIVNDYSARRLTYQKDRFPAIAGIAKEVQRHIPRNIRQACGWMTCT
jgi:hypothetical protein